MSQKTKSFFRFVLEIVQVAAIAAAIVLPVRFFIFQPFIVRGASMEPNFQDGNYLIIDELSYHLRSPQRGEIIVFKFPQDTSQRFIKRIVGLPFEQVEIKNSQIIITEPGGGQIRLNEIYYLSFLQSQMPVDDIKISLGKDEYFVLGDNREHSYDSRKWGAVPENDIVGRVVLRAWPPQKAEGYFKEIQY
ncbi:MAG: signal peptidase I [Patescibacteria group bacterium]|nr:signal peptidase I [Patescibacteria group bacterium]